MFQDGTSTAMNVIRYGGSPLGCGNLPSLRHFGWMVRRFSSGGGPVESNERYYRRRAVEERMAAQRAMTETARVWHAKLAEDFAQRLNECTPTCSQSAVAS